MHRTYIMVGQQDKEQVNRKINKNNYKPRRKDKGENSVETMGGMRKQEKPELTLS